MGPFLMLALALVLGQAGEAVEPGRRAQVRIAEAM
jgi:hypothetical protein